MMVNPDARTPGGVGAIFINHSNLTRMSCKACTAKT
jgi:hypothetical protein